jgi:glutamate-1-semialdehyde 2,1-aminomutase
VSYVTGSFWFAATAMAAGLATMRAIRSEGAIAAMERAGTALRDGILAQAAAHGLAVNYTGPVQMPYLTFAGDRGHELASEFAARAMRGGAYIHPRHNWSVSAAMTGADMALALAATDDAFAAVRRRLAGK